MRIRVVVVTVVLVGAALGAVALVAVLAWPSVRIAPSGAALTRVVLPDYAGTVAVSVRRADGARVPVRLRHGEVWPLRTLEAGEPLGVELTVRRPGWAGWLVGGTETRRFSIVTPTAHLRGRWLEVKEGEPVTIGFDRPVRVVWLGPGEPIRRLVHPRANVALGVRGSNAVGSVAVAAAARSWERLSKPARIRWFPARPYPQLLVSPRPGARIAPGRELRLTFSSPVDRALGRVRPRLSPTTPGRWRVVDGHTIAFRPGGLGFKLETSPTVVLPRRVHVVGEPGARLTTTLSWDVPRASTLRLQQLLAQAGYLPVDWRPKGAATQSSLRAQLAAAVAPPAGNFSWRFPNTPSELTSQWEPGDWNEITRGAVMMFQHEHGLAVDALPGPLFWKALLADAVAGKRRDDGYSYVFVHRSVPQSLNLWHDGAVIVSSPGNTGVPAAPTTLGTFPVFEHIPVGTMSGTNPDGTHYNDPGVRYISYFHGGEGIHAFNRASFGTPQSLGCVELPLDAAAKVWPYTPIGTLVTIED